MSRPLRFVQPRNTLGEKVWPHALAILARKAEDRAREREAGAALLDELMALPQESRLPAVQSERSPSQRRSPGACGPTSKGVGATSPRPSGASALRPGGWRQRYRPTRRLGRSIAGSRPCCPGTCLSSRSGGASARRPACPPRRRRRPPPSSRLSRGT